VIEPPFSKLSMPSMTHHILSSPSSSQVSGRRASQKVLLRNVNEAVLGNIAFETWYYSPYPDELIVPVDHKHSKSTNGDLTNGHLSDSSHGGPPLSGTVCPRLHVCPYCFSYSPIAEDYVTHMRQHEQLEKQDPDTPPVPEGAIKVYEHAGYAVWQVDGEQEKLYCQNLSLFGKLFLEQKSVFFDTGSFLYFVLTYTPPVQKQSPRAKKGSGTAKAQIHLRTQVLGFFSKENPSWDSNNLACILIFPPFQHRQLGKLLMAVSYKLSGWEWVGGIIGGPEKPLSTMGRRSYIRFWSERIARFMMGESADADGKHVFDKKRKNKVTLSKEEMSIKEIGERTGMLAEDVVAALNEMGVCEMVTRKKKKPTSTNGTTNGHSSEADAPPLTMSVKRSRILQWAKENRVDLEDPVKEEGFLGEWAASDVNDDSEISNDNPEEEDG
jgi:MOZ/SAS family